MGHCGCACQEPLSIPAGQSSSQGPKQSCTDSQPLTCQARPYRTLVGPSGYSQSIHHVWSGQKRNDTVSGDLHSV